MAVIFVLVGIALSVRAIVLYNLLVRDLSSRPATIILLAR